MIRECSKAQIRKNAVVFFSAIAVASVGLAVSVFDGEAKAAESTAPNPPTAFQCSRYTNANGNIVLQEEDCLGKKMVPDVAGADAESQRIALGLFMGTMKACSKYLTREGALAAGYSRTNPDGTPWQHMNSKNPQTITNVEAMFEQAANPPDIVIKAETGQIAQTMFDGQGFANLGTIPQIHNHGSSKHEMLHINCMPTIEGAFRYGYTEHTKVDSSLYEQAYEKARTGGISAVSEQMGLKPGAAAAVAAPVTGAMGATTMATPNAGVGTAPSRAATGVLPQQSVIPAAPVVRAPVTSTGPIVAPWAKPTQPQRSTSAFSQATAGFASQR